MDPRDPASPTRRKIIATAGIEIVPFLSAIIFGALLGVGGALFFDWITGVIGVIVGAVAGFLLGLAFQLAWSVAFIWAKTLREAIGNRNYVPIACGLFAAIATAVSLFVDGAANDKGLLAFGILVTFTLGAGIGGFIQGVCRRATSWTGRQRPPTQLDDD